MDLCIKPFPGLVRSGTSQTRMRRFLLLFLFPHSRACASIFISMIRCLMKRTRFRRTISIKVRKLLEPHNSVGSPQSAVFLPIPLNAYPPQADPLPTAACFESILNFSRNKFDIPSLDFIFALAIYSSELVSLIR
jgi:hypothetical protein